MIGDKGVLYSCTKKVNYFDESTVKDFSQIESKEKSTKITEKISTVESKTSVVVNTKVSISKIVCKKLSLKIISDDIKPYICDPAILGSLILVKEETL